MLTCKVGETIINCFDGKFDKYKLKQWDEEKRLICPDCGKLYEYCHGEVVSPYFRHKEKSKECEEIYSESETEEHIKGKMILYNWLMKLQEEGIISNLRLEGYIPETRQRPDIYFEKYGQRYVIEFQCTPIATEYLERHRLYELANIKDIWIMGINKYNIQVDGECISHNNYYKELEKHTKIYLNIMEDKLIISKNDIKFYLPYDAIWLNNYYSFNINGFNIDFERHKLGLSLNLLNDFIDRDKIKHEKEIHAEVLKRKENDVIESVVINLNIKFNKFNKGIYFFESDNGGYRGIYKYKILFNIKSSNTHFGSYVYYTFFIKNDKTDCCIEYEYSTPFRGKKGGLGWQKATGYKNVGSISYDKFDKISLESFILNKVSCYIRNQKYNI